MNQIKEGPNMTKDKVDIHSISSMRRAGILVSSEGIMLTEEEAASRMKASREFFKDLLSDMKKAMERSEAGRK
jgi:predicted DNA-binding protein (UPF0251 family)